MTVRLGTREFAPDHLAVMAIVNRTPDSFYDRGAHLDDATAMAAVDRAVAEGAEIVDLGGVKAGPGEPVDASQEIARTAGFVAAVRRRHPDLVISVDTWRAEVGRAVCEAGADLLNDPWQGADPGLAVVAAEHGAGLVCSHAGGLPPRTDPHRVAYDDVVADVVATVTGLAESAVAAGVRRVVTAMRASDCMSKPASMIIRPLSTAALVASEQNNNASRPWIPDSNSTPAPASARSVW